MSSGVMGMKSSMGIRFFEPGIWSVSISVPLLDIFRWVLFCPDWNKKEILAQEICWKAFIVSVPMPCWRSQQKNGEMTSQHQHYWEISKWHFYKTSGGFQLVSCPPPPPSHVYMSCLLQGIFQHFHSYHKVFFLKMLLISGFLSQLQPVPGLFTQRSPYTSD